MGSPTWTHVGLRLTHALKQAALIGVGVAAGGAPSAPGTSTVTSTCCPFTALIKDSLTLDSM